MSPKASIYTSWRKAKIICIHKHRKVSSRKTTISYAPCKIIWYAHSQKFLICAIAENFDMRLRSSIWYAQAQVIFGMRKRMSFWYAQTQISLICAGAGHFFMRRHRSDFHAHAQLIFFSICRAFVWYPVTQVSFETHFKLFSGNVFLFFKQLSYLFISNTCFVQSHSIILECVSYTAK